MSEEQGTASLQLALVVPTMMLLVLGVLQFGLWYHAQSVVQSAALESARVAAAEDGTGGAGREKALQVVGQGLGSAAMQPGASVSIDSRAARVRVTARLRALLPIPGLNSFPLSSTASVFRERFRSAEEKR